MPTQQKGSNGGTEAGEETIDTERLKKWLADEGRLRTEDALEIVRRATRLLEAEPTLLEVQTPVTSECTQTKAPLLIHHEPA